MRQLASIARNILAMLDGEAVEPAVELVLATVEGEYVPDGSGGTNQTTACETVRFTVKPEALRRMGSILIGYADEAEKRFAAAGLAVTPKTTKKGGA